jgi:hypothetical protein
MDTAIQVRRPWNKGIIVGQKRPLLPRQVSVDPSSTIYVDRPVPFVAVYFLSTIERALGALGASHLRQRD